MRNIRSSWLDGLLEAERLHKEGWVFEYQDGLRIQFRYKSLGDGPTMAFFSMRDRADYKHQDEFQKGCMDYVQYYVEHLERMNEISRC
jgi:hypothetical protein